MKPRETRFHKWVFVVVVGCFFWGFFFVVFFLLHVLMAVIHNSNSYFICNRLSWGIVLYLGWIKGMCISQKEMACYHFEMFHQSVTVLSEHQLTSKWVSIDLILFFYFYFFLFIYLFVCLLPQVRLQSVFGYKWYTVRRHCIFWSQDFLQDSSWFCLKNAEAAAQEPFASFPGVVAILSLASAGAVGCKCKIYKILLMSWFFLSGAGTHHTSNSLPVGPEGPGVLSPPEERHDQLIAQMLISHACWGFRILLYIVCLENKIRNKDVCL